LLIPLTVSRALWLDGHQHQIAQMIVLDAADCRLNDWNFHVVVLDHGHCLQFSLTEMRI
jgi:hypothetical protein